MKKHLILFLILTIYSCKENNNSLENVLLKNLKETSAFYETESKNMIMADFVRNEERSYSNKIIKHFFNYSEKINKTLIVALSKNKTTQLNEIDKLINEINLKSVYKFHKINKSDLENFSDDTAFYFIKNELYKNLYQNLSNYNKNNFSSPYCGSTFYKEEEKYELIEKLKKMKVQEFKDSICNSN